MSCVLLYIMFQAFLAHRDKKTVYSGEQTRQEPMPPLPPLEPSRPPPSETRASFSARSPDLSAAKTASSDAATSASDATASASDVPGIEALYEALFARVFTHKICTTAAVFARSA